MEKPVESVSVYKSIVSRLILWRSYIDWFSFWPIFTFHVIFPFGVPYVAIQSKTVIWSLVWGYLCAGLGLTAGYHRLWCHRSYQASRPLQYFLAILGAGAMQRTIRWWVYHHRAHHRYVDTYRDPYNAKAGLLWSHIGWVVTRHDRKNWGQVDVSDLENDEVVSWQHRNYLIIAAISGGLFPVLVAHFGWNDWKGGLLYAWIGRCILNWHLVWTINSLAHWVGDQPYSDKHTSRQNLLIALYSVGEGYHNYHHEFPCDYRNGPQWYDIDVTKWLIALWEKFGWTSHLNRTSSLVIEKCRLHQALKKSSHSLESKDQSQNTQNLPLLTWDQYVEKTENGDALLAIAGVVHDVAEFMAKHPGGEKLLRDAIGKDATTMFHGGLHSHSWSANNMLTEMQIAVIHGGGEIEGEKLT